MGWNDLIGKDPQKTDGPLNVIHQYDLQGCEKFSNASTFYIIQLLLIYIMMLSRNCRLKKCVLYHSDEQTGM